MELYLQIGVLVELAHAVFLFLLRLHLGLNFFVMLACRTFLSPLWTLLRKVLCCLVGRHELSFPACRCYM